MLHQPIDLSQATPQSLIEAQILLGLEACKSVSEIAQDIANALAVLSVDRGT